MLKTANLFELSEDTSQEAPSLQKKDIDMMVRIPAKKFIPNGWGCL